MYNNIGYNIVLITMYNSINYILVLVSIGYNKGIDYYLLSIIYY